MRRLSMWIFLALVGGVGGFAACDTGSGSSDSAGPGGGGVTCASPFDACGGDPVGSWNVTGFCEVAFEQPVDGCEATFSVAEDRSGGTVELNADGTYSRSYQIDLDYRLQLPKQCLAGSALGGLSCEDAGAHVGMTCTDLDESCSCDTTEKSTDAASGDWVVEGNTIVTDRDTDDEERLDFCVVGSTAVTRDQDGTRIVYSR